MNKKSFTKKNVLSQSSFWIINKAMAKEIGIEATLLLSDLVSKQDYFFERKMLDVDGFFFNERSDIEFDTTLSPHKQTHALSILKELKLVEFKRKGIPPKMFYRVNNSKVNEFLMSIHN